MYTSLLIKVKDNFQVTLFNLIIYLNTFIKLIKKNFCDKLDYQFKINPDLYIVI